MKYNIVFSSKNLTGKIRLPFSKSISNRLLVIQAFAKEPFCIHNLSESDDTIYMHKAFDNNSSKINIGHAGTAMRFLTAYYAAVGQSKIITGSERMQKRPIGVLVDALNSLGADISYIKTNGFPPIKTSGKLLNGKEINLNGSVSSQYISALLLIAPILPDGLTIKITDTLISSSYVALTLGMMHDFGILSSWKGNTIEIPHQNYQSRDYTVEADWSAASYWYQLALLSDEAEIELEGLFNHSFQGDYAIADIFQLLGIETVFHSSGVTIRKREKKCDLFSYDFLNNPDMVQTLIVSLCLKGIPFKLTGAQSLRIKETDRIAALQQEMGKLGFRIHESQPGVLEWDGKKSPAEKSIQIETYDDHRMALAFAPAALYFPGMVINDIEVVTKSYPNFWNDLRLVGANLRQVE
jgi:3-phosphoshikimate 1-carboxyvinyltransferase